MVIGLSPQNQLSLYFHIPFCTRKCDYCHFYVVPDKEQFKNLLLRGLESEWKLWLPHISNYSLSTIYFGGGTPALFGPENIAEVLSWINETFPFATYDPEITLEANPENITIEMMQAYSKAGINRVSIGVQSLNDSELTLLTRQHNSNKAVEGIHATYDAGITNISIDLMYDLPSQTVNLWQNTLKKLVELPISHVSLYNLTIEPHTVFHKYKDKLAPLVPKEQISLDMYTSAIDHLEKIGLHQYEISAFAKDGNFSKHNTGYWTGRPFIGFGPSAYSFWKGERFRNVANLHKYAKALEEGNSPVDYRDTLSVEDRRKELLAVAVRLSDGVDYREFQELFGELSEETLETLGQLIQNGLVMLDERKYKLTPRGVLLYDSVAAELI